MSVICLLNITLFDKILPCQNQKKIFSNFDMVNDKFLWYDEQLMYFRWYF